MKKINTKNILKKIFKKKTEKNKKIVKKRTKVFKNLKIIKKQKVKKVKKIKKNIIKTKKKENIETKNDSLRISKTNELKPEIKKVKKQQTEKRQYKIKDYVVYPKLGVGQITEFKKIDIGGIDVETYVMRFEKDKAEWIPLENLKSRIKSFRRWYRPIVHETIDLFN